MRAFRLLQGSPLTAVFIAAGIVMTPLIFRSDVVRAEGTPAASPLAWENLRVELSPGLEAYRDGMVEARFPFSNGGSAAWEITAVEPDCGCTAAELTQSTLAPGERGEVVARFAVAERGGRQEKHLLVRARAGSGAGQAVTRLTLVVNLPDLVRITPAKLRWALGEEAKPKTLVVEAASGEMPITRCNVRSTQALFKVEVREVEIGRRYEATVTPGSTEVLLTAHLPVSCEFAPPAASNATATAPTASNPPRLFVVVADIVPPTASATASAP